MKKLLLSIRPEYVEAIFTGKKLVEYRKQMPKNESVNIVLIYRSNDIKQIVGEFTIGGYVSGTPKEVWEKTKNIGGIDEDRYFDYFKGREHAYAFLINDLIKYDEYRDLKEFNISRPPMSYMYIEDKIN